MKEKKLKTYRAKADVIKIDCSVLDAEINFTPTSRPALVIEFSKNLKPHFAEGDGVVTLRQLKKPLFQLHPPVVNFLIPECSVPDLTLRMQNGSLTMNGIIFNDVDINGDDIKTEISGCTFENIAVKAKDLDISAEEITVKNLANTVADDGRVEIDKSFCKKTECRMKNGNIGVSCSTCEFTVLDAGNGSVAANMVGNEKDYTINLEGASVTGKENISESGKSFRARSATGSVVVDFSPPEGEAEVPEEETKTEEQKDETPEVTA
ncbi:MAG: DUF4097 family beta strand repeat-containing protein [Clostridia bacterium]|nr:DUF4097 family beta strand repeat-containing protein [Clostridia bacterium]